MVMTHLQLAKVEEAKLEEEMVEKLSQRLPDFYRGRCVLVTGGSGFVGRVLVEKLLRSCPDIHTIYLLLRTRKGVPPNERLKKLTDVPLFDRLREECPDALAKVQVVAGDTAEPGLGLSAADVQLLRKNVSVVFHLAASVRFDDSLEFALRTNVRSTFELLELATQMPQLRAFVHVSTAYCNMGQYEYEEKLYPAPTDWRVLLKAVDTLEPHHLRVITEKILGQYPNTYTFTKILAEHVVNEYRDRLPVGILRPSIVTGTVKDPIPGWIDNFYGPMSLLVGGAKGLVHTGLVDPDTFLDYIPCDVVVKGLMISSCDIARKGVGDLVVYQGAQSEVERIKQIEVVTIGQEFFSVYPFKHTLYHPCGTLTTSTWLFNIQFFFFHLLYAVLADAVLYATGRKPMLVRLQRRIYLANLALAWFATRNWRFVNRRFLSLERKLVKSDMEDFAINLHLLDIRSYIEVCLIGTRRYLIHESEDDLPLARRRYKRLRIVHLILKTLFYSAVIWIVLIILRGILMRLLDK